MWWLQVRAAKNLVAPLTARVEQLAPSMDGTQVGSRGMAHRWAAAWAVKVAATIRGGRSLLLLKVVLWQAQNALLPAASAPDPCSKSNGGTGRVGSRARTRQVKKHSKVNGRVGAGSSGHGRVPCHWPGGCGCFFACVFYAMLGWQLP